MKLFAFESEEEEKPSELLIDKLTEQRKVKKDGISVTADLIKQRQELKVELNKEYSKADNEEENKPEETTGGSEEESSNSQDESGETSEETPPENNEPTEPEDGETGAEDLDNLKSMVGSAHSESGEKEEAKVSTESYRPKGSGSLRGLSVKSFFTGIKDKYKKYCVSLESMDLSSYKKPIQEQPVAYVKEDVLLALNNLIGLAGKYTSNNNNGIEQSTKGIKSLAEKITIYKDSHSREKLSFTSKMVSADDIKTALSYPNVSDMRETAGLLVKYLDSSGSIFTKLLSNPLSEFPSVLGTSGFSSTGEGSPTLDYKAILPGFYKVCASFTPYTTYLETDYENYQIFRLKTFKLQDLYNLDHITITEDKEFIAVMDKADAIVMAVGMSIDNLKSVNENYVSFIDELKVLSYEVEKGEKTKLADLELDKKMQDFIKYKLVSEMYVMNISMGIEYLTSLVSAMIIMAEIRD